MNSPLDNDVASLVDENLIFDDLKLYSGQKCSFAKGVAAAFGYCQAVDRWRLLSFEVISFLQAADWKAKV